MSQPNPFAQHVPTAPAAEPAVPQQPTNPYGQPPAAPQAPQAYAPAPSYAPPVAQPNPYGAPQQQAPQAYAPQQQAPATSYGTGPVAQTVPQQAVPTFNMGNLASAAEPEISSGGAKLADMYGRLVLIFPLSISRVPRSPKYVTDEQRAAGNLEQDRMTATVVVLDDGQGGMAPIAFGGAPYELPPRAHTSSAPLPYVRKAMWINQSRLISQLRPYLPAAGNGQGMVAGRVTKAGPAQNDPWYLIGATGPEMELAGQYLNLVSSGQQPNPLA